MGNWCVRAAVKNGDQGGTNYESLDERHSFDFKPDNREYYFNLRILLNMKMLRNKDTIEKFRFNVTYGEITKNWAENFRFVVEENFCSKPIDLMLDHSLIKQHIRVEVQVLGSNRKIIDSLNDEFNFYKGAINNFQIVSNDTPIRIRMSEQPDDEIINQLYTYKLDMTYDETILGSYNVDKIKAVFSQVTDAGINDLYETYLNSRWTLLFSTAQIIGKKTNLKNLKFQIELQDMEANKTLARSNTFSLFGDLLNKKVQKSLKNDNKALKIKGWEIKFSNLMITQVDNMRDGSFSRKAFKFSIASVYRKPSTSIFKYFSNSNMKVIPYLGLDFSQANLTFDDDICLHRTKEDKPKIYLKLINKFIEAIKPFSTDYSLPYAFGWKPMPGGSTSDCLALSGDYFNPQVNHKDLEKRYLKTVNKIEFALPPNHSKIFETLQKFIDLSFQSNSQHFFTHLHITPGLVEDYTNIVKIIEETPIDQPWAHIIIRIKIDNLIEQDVDIRHLMKDICSYQKRKKHSVTMYTIHSSASEIEVDGLISRIMTQLMQHIETYIDLSKKNTGPVKKFMNIQTSKYDSFTDYEYTSSSNNSKTFATTTTYSDEIQYNESDFLNKIILSLSNEKSVLENELKDEFEDFSRERFNSIIIPDKDKQTIQLIYGGESYTEASESI